MDNIAYPPSSPLPHATPLANLDSEHLQCVEKVLSAILALDFVVDAFAQIIDGLPTRPTFEKHFKEPPLLSEISERERPREKSTKLFVDFKQNLDISTLHLNSKVVQAYQSVPSNSWQFEVRLLEVIAIVIHTLGGAIYYANHPQTDIHPLDPKEAQLLHYYLDFYHGAYMAYHKYPYGLLDMIGYWMETQIFGGVILVQHDEAECEAQSLFLHTQWSGIFQLSETQVHISPLNINKSLPFMPEPGAHKLTRNQLSPSHVFRDEFSRVYPFYPTPIRCVAPMTDEDREIIKWGNENSRYALSMATATSEKTLKRDSRSTDELSKSSEF